MSERPYGIREPDEGDRAFVLSTWMRAARHGLRDVPDGIYYDAKGGYRRCIEGYMDRGQMAVAHDVTDPEIIYGWACGEGGVLHFAYTRLAFRRQGIAHSLVRHLRCGEGLHPLTTHPIPPWAERWGWEHDEFATPVEGHHLRAWLVGQTTAYREIRIVPVR